MEEFKYKRVLIKISGEALAGDKHSGLNQSVLVGISQMIKEVYDKGIEMAIVVGGGNFWRGRTSQGMDRTTADHIGMLATVMNSLALKDAFEAQGIPTRVQSAIDMSRIAEPYIRGRAIRHLEKKRVVIFGCGTGNPFFSTDTAAALRAAEIDAEAILLAKKIDAVYDSDPEKNPDAKKYKQISFGEILNKQLGVMDLTAASLCMDNDIPVIVFGIKNPQNVMSVLKGENVGTVIKRNIETI